MISATGLDLLAPLPITKEAVIKSNFQRLDEWTEMYKDRKVITEVKHIKK
jgi:hypothetical protein